MKKPELKFFTREENEEIKNPFDIKKLGRITKDGKLTFSAELVTAMNVLPDFTKFLIATDLGKRKMSNLYLIPSTESGAFDLELVGKRFFISISKILKDANVSFEKQKITFKVEQFNHTDKDGKEINAFKLIFIYPVEKK